jgi:hypothetical protein
MLPAPARAARHAQAAALLDVVAAALDLLTFEDVLAVLG